MESKLTEEKFQEIVEACSKAYNYSLWDLRLLVDEVKLLREKIRILESSENQSIT